MSPPPKENLVKILNASLTHFGFKYQEGLNVDTVPFNPSGTCEAGGLYFTIIKEVPYFAHFGTLVADVSIPDDAKVYGDIDLQKWKADRIIISNIRSLRKLFEGKTDTEIAHHVSSNGMLLEYVPPERISEKLYSVAVAHDGMAIQYIPIQQRTFELCEIAVKQNGWALFFVPKKHHTPELCKIAVQQNGDVLEFVPYEIKQSSPEVCTVAVKNDGWAIRFVPRELRVLELCLIALKQNGTLIQLMAEKVLMSSKETYRIALQQNGLALQFLPDEISFMPEYRDELYKIAVQQNGRALKYVPRFSRTLELCKMAMAQDAGSRTYVPENLWNEMRMPA